MLQSHVYEPALSVHDACASHGLEAHSSTFVQLHPSPEYPVLHAHAYEPSLSVHDASAWHGLEAHSSTFAQLHPSPE